MYCIRNPKLYLLGICIMGLFSCFKATKPSKKPAEKFGQGLGIEHVEKHEIETAFALGKEHNKRVLVLLLDPASDPDVQVKQMGAENTAQRQWKNGYLLLKVSANSTIGKALIEKHYVKALPASLLFENNNPDTCRVLYGRLAPGNRPYLSPPLTQQILGLYQSGDRDPRLIDQLYNHLLYVPRSPKEKDLLSLELNDIYFSRYSRTDLASYAGYRAMIARARDVRLHVMGILMEERQSFNQQFQRVIADRGLKNKNQDADWIIVQALRRSFEKALALQDSGLFEQCIDFKEKVQKGYMDPWIATSIFKYQLSLGDSPKAYEAALQYFESDPNWYYSREFGLMEAGAKLVVDQGGDRTTWQNAQKWITRAIDQRETPTRFAILADLLDKLGETDQAAIIREKSQAYTKAFLAFVKLYPPLTEPLTLTHQNITQNAFDELDNIPKGFDIFSSYISREGNLFKRGEKIEPIALLDTTEKEMRLLSRVHLETGSLLPVRHFRSYYVQTSFSISGEFIRGTYIYKDVMTP